MTLDASDEILAKHAQTGDKEAFMVLYNRYLRRVYNRVKSKVPPNDADDVTQEVFIAVVRSLRSYRQEARFNTWLYTIVNRQIADFYRRRGRGGHNPAMDVDIDTTENLTAVFDGESSDQRFALQKALNALPEHYQDVILLRFADGLTFGEIAEQRGQSLEAIKSLYRRAIQAMRDAISEG